MFEELIKSKKRILTGIYSKDEFEELKGQSSSPFREVVEEIPISKIIPLGGYRISKHGWSVESLELPSGDYLVVDTKEDDDLSSRFFSGYNELMSDYRTFLEEQEERETKIKESGDSSLEMLEPESPNNMTIEQLDEDTTNHLTVEGLSNQQEDEKLCL